MRKTSLLERIRLLGRSGLDVLEALGRSTLFLGHALIGRRVPGGMGTLLVKQLYAVGVLSLAIIVVSGIYVDDAGNAQVHVLDPAVGDHWDVIETVENGYEADWEFSYDLLQR